MAKLSVHVANCPVGGADVTAISKTSWRRDRIDLRLGGFTFTIRQLDAGGHGAANTHETVHTTSLEFGDVRPSRRHAAEVLAQDVCWLLSLATMSPVRPLCYEYGSTKRHQAVTQRMSVYRPTLDPADGDGIRRFLVATWPAFRRLKQSRRLARVIDMLVMADHPDQPVEVSCLLAMITLEALKGTLPHTGTLRHRLTRMFRDVGMRPGIRRIVRLRNDLVHEGLFRSSRRSFTATNDRTRDLLHEYLFRLLSYRGPVLLYSASARRAKTI